MTPEDPSHTGPALAVNVVKGIGNVTIAPVFTVQSGIAVLLGPSASGKSVTLSMIAGLRKPDSGVISLSGRAVFDSHERVNVRTQDRHIGMVFQDGLLLPHRTVLANVALAVRHHRGRKAKRAQAHDLLEQVGAGELADRKPGSLSGGQRQRVALARGLAGDPNLVLLDEPLSALHEEVRIELGVLIREVIHSTGIPAVLVTHDLDEARRIGDSIIRLDRGRVVEHLQLERTDGAVVPTRRRIADGDRL